MQGDFSRDSFDSTKNFTRVLQQQGRVQLDADWNEQVSIFWYHWRTFIKDLIGPYGGPESNCGFGIYTSASDIETNRLDKKNLEDQVKKLKSGQFLLGSGNYYVNGISCIKREYIFFTEPAFTESGDYLIYLDIWERHVTEIEDDSVREIALGGADTCTRAKVECLLRTQRIDNRADLADFFKDSKDSSDRVRDNWNQFKSLMQLDNRGLLKVYTSTQESEDLAAAATDSRFRGAQNQLYRIEIHSGGPVEHATFKWSRENGSVVFPIVSPGIIGSTITVGHLGKDKRSGLQVGDWVEIVDDDSVMKNLPRSLCRVTDIVTSKLQVTLSIPSSARTDLGKHPRVQRWDQKQVDVGEIKINENQKIPLENGIAICFTRPPPAASANHYQTGDYWLIPARTKGIVEWPTETDVSGTVGPVAVPPRGDHHYAPLAIVNLKGNALTRKSELRFTFLPFPGAISK